MSAEELLAQLADPKVRAVKEYRRTLDGDLADRRQVRRTEVPPGVCESCYRQRRSDSRAGDLYTIGYPSLVPRLVCYCPSCAERTRRLNVELVQFTP